MYKIINILFLSTVIFSCVDVGSAPQNNEQASGEARSAVGDAYRGPSIVLDVPSAISSDADSKSTKDYRLIKEIPKNDDKEIIEEIKEKDVEELDLYPEGPHAIELFGIIPDLVFYEPWKKEWVRISEYYKHPEHKALLIVSSAGWCGPCQLEASKLVDFYNDYHEDGLEIAYTLIQSFVQMDWIFTDPENEQADLFFMEQWKEVPLYYDKDEPIQYPLYADPTQALGPYIPPNEYGLPFTILITTKDMGVRFMSAGYSPNLLENKIILVLYSDVPDLPFK